MTKRHILVSLSIVLLAGLAACDQGGGDDDTAGQGGATLTVATMGGSWQQRVAGAVAPELEKAGITVKYVQSNAQETLPRLISARGQTPPFDVIEVDDQTYEDLKRGDFLEPLDKSKLPNLADVDPGLYDDYKVAYWVSQPSIIYNKDKFAQAGITPPARYTDLASPALRGKVGISDLGVYSGFYVITGFATENGGSAADPQPGFDVLAKIQPHSYLTSTATAAQLFNTGDLWVITMPAGFAVRLAEAGASPAVVQPRIDGKLLVAHGYLAIPKGGRNREAALAFINAALAADAQHSLYKQTAIIPSNTKALEAVAADSGDKGKAFQTLDARAIANGYVPDFAHIDRKDWIARWDRAVEAQPR